MDDLTQVDDSADPPEFADDYVKESSKHSLAESAPETALDPEHVIPTKTLSPRKFLFILSAVIFLLMVLLAVTELTGFLFLQYLTTLDPGNKNEEKEEPYSEFDLNAASEMMTMMDHTVEPCDDFYSYACGGWISRTSALNSTIATSSLEDEFKKAVQKYMEVIQKPAQKTDPLYKQQPRNLFAACNNKEHRKKLGNAPFIKLADPLGRFIATGKYIAREALDFQTILTKMARLGVHPFFVVYRYKSVRSEPKLKISKPRKLQYWSMNTYFLWVFQVMDRLAPRWRDTYVDCFVTFYSNIIQQPRGDNYENEMVSIQELQRSIPELEWSQFFRDVTAGTSAANVSVSSYDTVVVEYGLIQMLSRVFQYDNNTLGFYLLVTLLPFTVGLYPDFPKYGNVENLLNYPAFSYLNDCYRETFRYFPDQVNRLYFDEVLNLTLTPTMHELMSDLKTSFRSGMADTTWLSKEKKATLRDSLDFTKEHYFPALLLNDAYLNNMYKTIETTDYFDFFLERSRFFFNQSMEVEKTRNPQPVHQDIHDRYKLSGIDVSLGLPSPDKKKSIIFGTTGWSKALAMSLSILMLMYDETNSNYEAYTQCVYDLFPKTLPDDNKNNPPIYVNLTIRESLALQKSYEAYQMFRKRHGDERPLPDLGLNNDQLFFLSYTQRHCEWFPPGESSEKLPSQKSSVLATLMNSAEFAETFQCKKGSPMNSVVKCKFL